MLHERHILYAPDYVINAGGMLQASSDIFKDYDEDRVMERIRGLYETSLEIFHLSKQENRATYEIADELARRRITSQNQRKA
jgi:leucine dehydrogenase